MTRNWIAAILCAAGGLAIALGRDDGWVLLLAAWIVWE